MSARDRQMTAMTRLRNAEADARWGRQRWLGVARSLGRDLARLRASNERVADVWERLIPSIAAYHAMRWYRVPGGMVKR